MIDNAFELVTQTMERQYPDHVAFRYCLLYTSDAADE